MVFNSGPGSLNCLMKKLTLLLALLASMVALVACPGPEPNSTATSSPSTSQSATATSSPLTSPTATATTAAAATPTPQDEVVAEDVIGSLLQPGGVVLFGRISGGSSSDSLRTTDGSGQIRDIPLETSSHALVMVPVLPARGEPIVFQTYTSPSYAKNVASPTSVDDRLFIVRSWDGGSTDVSEYDLKTLEAFPSAAAAHLSKAVVGDTAYSYSYPKYDNFTGWRGQLEFVRQPFNGGQETRTFVRDVRGYLDDPYFPLTIMATGQKLFGLITPFPDKPRIVVVGVDQSTGEPTEIATYAVNFDDYIRGSWDWAADNGFVYWVATRIDEGETIAEIYWHELERESVIESASLTLPEGVTGIFGFDVDDGYIVLNPSWESGNHSALILFDLSTSVTEIVDLGFDISAVQIIHLGE